MTPVKTTNPAIPFIDRVVGWASPAAGLRRLQARKALEFSYKGTVGSRLERTPTQKSKRAKFYSETDYQESLSEKANNLVNVNPAAEGLVERLVEGIVSERIDMIAQTSDPEWNKKHTALWEEWAEFQSDARGMDDFTGLVYFIVRGLVVDGRIGVLLLDSGALQLVESPRFQTPIDKLSDPDFVNGVELNRLGRPVRFHLLKDPLKGLIPENIESVDGKDMVYFAMRKHYGDTSGRTKLGESFDNFEQIDATFEAVITAAQVAASYSVIFKGTNQASTLQANTRPQTDSQGNPARGFDLEPGTAKYLNDFESAEQLKPEHPSQNLVEFLREVLRFAALPSGVPLELLTMDFSKINYSGARSMNLFFDRVCRVARARYLYRGLKRIYAWRTSKWIKAEELPEPGEKQAWKCRIQHAGLPWVDPVADADADQIMADRGWEADSEIIRRRGGNPEKVFAQIDDDKKARAAAGIEEVWSSKTRHKIEPQPAASAGGSEGDGTSK